MGIGPHHHDSDTRTRMSRPGLTEYKKKIDSRSGNSGKSLITLLRITKNVRVPGRQFQKKIASDAEDFKKYSGSGLQIPENLRIGC